MSCDVFLVESTSPSDCQQPQFVANSSFPSSYHEETIERAQGLFSFSFLSLDLLPHTHSVAEYDWIQPSCDGFPGKRNRIEPE